MDNEWLRWIAGGCLVILGSYYTTKAKVDTAIARLEEREDNHYTSLREEITELKRDVQWGFRHGAAPRPRDRNDE